MSDKKYVIVGNSYAAIFAVEAIRQVDSDGSITLISSEQEHVYSRAMLHEWLSGLAGDDLFYLRPKDFYEKHKVSCLLGRTVTGINLTAKQVLLDGDIVAYDKLLFGVGGEPFVPEIAGLDKFNKGIFSFISVDDARRIKGFTSKSDGRIVVLGAGLIGLQCAEALSQLGLKVAVVELMDTVLPLAVDAPAAELISLELAEEGIEIYTGDSVVNVTGQRKVVGGVVLKSGKTLDCSGFVIAVGVRPRVKFLAGTGIAIDRGIVVNNMMETNVPDIYAAGDCAQGPEIITGKTMVLPIIPVASEQGNIAGFNMAGRKKVYKGGIAMNALQFGRLQIVSYGFVKDEEGSEVLKFLDKAQKIYKKVIIKNGRITGAIFVKAVDRAGVFRYLIQNKIDVSGFKDRLLDDNFGLPHLPGELRKQLLITPQ